MTTTDRTLDAADLTRDAAPGAPRVFLALSGEPTRASRVIDLAAGQEISFGRSRSATVSVDHDKVSRLHARIWRAHDEVWIEDLGSRNGTRVNGARVTAPRALSAGDELAIGPVTAILGRTSPLALTVRLADAGAIEDRLAAELDRATRYRRSVALLMVRVPDDDGAEQVARTARRMDLVGDYGGDDLAVVAPELDRAEAVREGERLIAAIPGARVGIAIGPSDGTSVARLIAHARAALAGEVAPAATGGPLIVDPAMVRLYQTLERLADSAMTVLILGETGVGKEVIAEAIHARSARRAGPFIRLNCAAIPEALFESELFGHERGAFTGADRRKTGFVEAAAGGTLLLDEVGELPAPAQAKLLRVLEQKAVTRVGGTEEIAVDVRLLAATNVDLEAEARAGRFREDLYFRIAQFTLVNPPLRDRRDEIVPLAERFLAELGRARGQAPPTLSDEARLALTAYDWPGNVRELRNAMERAAVLAGGGPITAAELSERAVDAGRRRGLPLAGGVKGQLADVERTAIVAALEAEGGNQSGAARRLGLSRRGLIYKLEKYGLKAPPPSAGQRRPPGGGL